MQGQATQILIKLYTDFNTLLVKHATHLNTNFLWAASLSKINNTVKNNYISNTSYAEFPMR